MAGVRLAESLLVSARYADTVLERLGEPVTKGASLLSTIGFGRMLRELMANLRPIAVDKERKAILQALEELDVNWPILSEDRKEKAIKAAAEAIANIPSLVIVPVIKELVLNAENVVVLAKRASVKQYGFKIAPSFNTTDKIIIDHAANSQGNYITDRYKRRAEVFSVKAREIISSGLEQGFGRKDIGAQLATKLRDPALRTADSYWEAVASIHIARSRSWGQLSAFTAAEIEWFVWNSVLDEVTSEGCRFLNGRRFSTMRAAQRYMQVEGSSDPKAAQNLQPFIQKGRDKDGNEFLFVKQNEQRVHIADVEKSGVGVADKIGKYSRVNGNLEGLGVQCPPSHGNCRSQIDPA